MLQIARRVTAYSSRITPYRLYVVNPRRVFSQSHKRLSLNIASNEYDSDGGYEPPQSSLSPREKDPETLDRPEHAVISTFDLLSIGSAFLFTVSWHGTNELLKLVHLPVTPLDP
jgi:hypothetical protein